VFFELQHMWEDLGVVLAEGRALRVCRMFLGCEPLYTVKNVTKKCKYPNRRASRRRERFRRTCARL
jgi:hypothetical protein